MQGGNDGAMKPSTPVLGTPFGRTEFLGLDFDAWPEARVRQWLGERGAESPFAYIVTPNVDHMVRLSEEGAASAPWLWGTYREAALCLCDSRVLSRLARFCGVDLPVVPGSDLVASAFASVLVPGDRICLIGATATTAAALAARFPALDILHHDAPMGLARNPDARAEAIAFARQTRARLYLLAIGSPQQELLAWEMARAGGLGGTALCIGAAVEFLVDARSRAPRLVQRAGLEWAWRLIGEPRRMWRRYLVDGPAIFPAVWRWRRARRRR